MSRLNGNTQAAIYHVFEQQLTDRGLVSEPEFFLPPNEFDIVGGVADSRRGEYALIAPIDANEDDMLDWQDITTANQKATNFLQNCTEFCKFALRK